MPAKINAEALLDLIPESKLEALALETQVDHGVKKFTGHLLFKLLLYSCINSTKVSQRVIESFFNSRPFQFLMNLPPGSRTRHSTISERLAQVKVGFFQGLYRYVVQEFGERYGLRETSKGLLINRFDSTTVSLSSQLLHFGMSNGGQRGKANRRANGLHQIKFSVGFDGVLIPDFKMYTEQPYLNESRALSEILLEQHSRKGEVLVFDRGMQSRETFALMVDQKLQFVTRVKTFPRHETIENLTIKNATTPTLQITEDRKVYVFSEHRKIQEPMRLVVGVRHDNEEIICFLIKSSFLMNL